jgi:hypothetical protein
MDKPINVEFGPNGLQLAPAQPGTPRWWWEEGRLRGTEAVAFLCAENYLPLGFVRLLVDTETCARVRGRAAGGLPSGDMLVQWHDGVTHAVNLAWTAAAKRMSWFK